MVQVCLVVRAFAGRSALTVWSVSGGRTMVFSMVFITSFHSSFNTRFSTVFSQILANSVRLAEGIRDRGKTGNEGKMNNMQQKEANVVVSFPEEQMRKRRGG